MCRTPPADLPAAVRFQEVFADLVGIHAAESGVGLQYLFDDRFMSFLSEEERELRRRTVEMVRALDRQVRRCSLLFSWGGPDLARCCPP